MMNENYTRDQKTGADNLSAPAVSLWGMLVCVEQDYFSTDT